MIGREVFQCVNHDADVSIRFGILSREVGCQRVELCTRRFNVSAFHSGHRGPEPNSAACGCRTRPRRPVEFVFFAGRRVKRFGQNPRDAVRGPIEQKIRSDRARIASHVSRPEAMRQHDGAMTVDGIIGLGEAGPEGHRHTKHREKVW
jgi:hypothetical protein